MRRVSIVLAACLLMAAADPASSPPPAPPPTPAIWLQERLDRILARIGSAPGEVKAVLTDGADLPWVHPKGSVQYPRALLVMAPTPEAVDAMLAMLLSYQPEDVVGGRPPVPGVGLSGRSYASNGDREEQPRLTIGGGESNDRSAPDGRDTTARRREQAWQGMRWNGQIGNCTETLVNALRVSGQEARPRVGGKSFFWPGSSFSRDVIKYLGSQAYPGGDRRCRTSEDPDFDRIRQELETTPEA